MSPRWLSLTWYSNACQVGVITDDSGPPRCVPCDPCHVRRALLTPVVDSTYDLLLSERGHYVSRREGGTGQIGVGEKADIQPENAITLSEVKRHRR